MAELRPGQKDEDSLPPYSVLDRILEGLVDKEMSVNEVANATGADVALAIGPVVGGFLVESSLVWSASALTTAKLPVGERSRPPPPRQIRAPVESRRR